jgi:transposase-like protein
MERGGTVIAGVVKDTRRKTIQPHVRGMVEPGSTIYTDALASYVGLEDEYLHETVDHAKEYVRGDVHTNCMENFWSLLKRCIHGTYIAVMPWNLNRYVDEQALRFNERYLTDGDRFHLVISGIVGKRLQSAELIG